MRKFHSPTVYQTVIRLGVVKACLPVIELLISVLAMTACHGTVPPLAHDTTGPIFHRITTSSKSFSIDCVPTAVTITANITDPSGIKRAVLFSRVGTDRAYSALDMKGTGDEYSVTVKAADMPGKGYGTWEFYITAEDLAGQQSQSALDKSVEMLICVSN